MAKKHALLLQDKEKDDDKSSTSTPLLLTQNGQKVNLKTFVETRKFLASAIDEYSDGQERPDNRTSPSIGAFLDDKFYGHLRNGGYSEEDSKVKEAIYKMVVWLENVLNATSSLYDLSPEAYTVYDEGEGNQMVVLKHGYMSLCDIVKEPIPDAATHLNMPVTKILWNQGECSCKSAEPMTQDFLQRNICHQEEEEEGKPLAAPVAIETATGLQIGADHIICTVPIGVLKTEALQLFDPALPSKTMKAIHDIGYGTMNKIFLEWDKPWWNRESCKQILFLWREDLPFELECIKKEDNVYYEQVRVVAFTKEYLNRIFFMHGFADFN